MEKITEIGADRLKKPSNNFFWLNITFNGNKPSEQASVCISDLGIKIHLPMADNPKRSTASGTGV